MTAPPGWYADPWLAHQLRWWDGERWTGHVGLKPVQVQVTHRMSGGLKFILWVVLLFVAWPLALLWAAAQVTVWAAILVWQLMLAVVGAGQGLAHLGAALASATLRPRRAGL